MKSFDLLSRPNSQITKKTWTGGVLSLLCFLVLIFLLHLEYLNWSDKRLTKNIYVDNINKEESILVTLSIILPNVPCSIVSLDVHDNLDHHRENIMIQKFRVQNNTELLDEVNLKAQ